MRAGAAWRREEGAGKRGRKGGALGCFAAAPTCDVGPPPPPPPPPPATRQGHSWDRGGGACAADRGGGRARGGAGAGHAAARERGAGGDSQASRGCGGGSSFAGGGGHAHSTAVAGAAAAATAAGAAGSPIAVPDCCSFSTSGRGGVIKMGAGVEETGQTTTKWVAVVGGGRFPMKECGGGWVGGVRRKLKPVEQVFFSLRGHTLVRPRSAGAAGGGALTCAWGSLGTRS